MTHPGFNMVFEPDADLIYGVVTQRFRRELRRAGIVVATKFRPGGFHPFHPVSGAHADRPDDPGIAASSRRCAIAGDELERIAAIEAGMRAHGSAGRPARGGDRRALRGDARRADDRRELGCARRLLQAHAAAAVPRVRGRVAEVGAARIRLHEAADRMADGEQDWPRLALELGYFDQAHFIKAFKASIGRSPAEYALATG